MSRSLAFAAVAVALCAMLGAGCGRADETEGGNQPVDQVIASTTLKGIIAGDAVILEEGNGVVNGKLVEGPLTRKVVLSQFVLGGNSAASWELTSASGTFIASSSWVGGGLDTAHLFYLPGAFERRNRPVGDAALLWLAKQEFAELRATSGTTIDPEFVSAPEWKSRVGTSVGAGKAFAALTTLAGYAFKDGGDLTYVRTEGQPAMKTIRINGADVAVPVIAVRSWFGRYEILDRADNPLVLSFTLDPRVDVKQLDVTKGDGAELSKLVNYQVKEIVFTER